ncbi:basic membrane protein A-related proteins [Ketogulonicigenium robustum]|uniref:Basic membrane protein A-related proteins n=1 Tax=Ketogulonicigenium robustum TaxID=92947 RepID=A0A1W6NXP0_9RHOB|nr:BMP family ABC transporter substrate-binding protein [Ketogulonicigenium robustum]ARO14002.1 basic membrane protein A-related proteins [Ketogulonicigenium robustum]
MNVKSLFLCASATLALTAGAALADGPAVIYDLGGKFDKSFNESSFNGATAWANETGNSFAEVELSSDAQRSQAIRNFAEAGYNPIVMAGFSNATPLAEVAPDYPDTKFVIIDGVVDAPNVRSILFAEEQGSFLVGMLAALKSETGTVSFVGGMDIPLIRNFACGYAQGAKAANPSVNVISNMVGTTPAAWADSPKATELAMAQIGQGSDVIYAAAGGAGLGALQTAADSEIYGIGVDSNQNYLHPGHMLTSMLKRVDNAVYESFMSGADIETGLVVMDLASGGVGFAQDEYNADLLTPEMLAAVEAASARIISGEIAVHNYNSDETCPVLSF